MELAGSGTVDRRRSFRFTIASAHVCIFDADDVILVLGIGVNAAIFSVAHAVIRRPLSYSDPDRLVSISMTWPAVRSTVKFLDLTFSVSVRKEVLLNPRLPMRIV
jgi:hypothetical protein